MPVKSIVQIEVADQAFDSFQKKFESYLGELDKQQEKWEKAGAAMGMSGEALAGGAFNAKESLAVAAAQAGIISEALADAVKAQNDLGSATKRSGEHMGKLHTAAKGVGSAISSIGGWIVRIAAFGGIGGLLSGLGIADLAGAAFNRSKSAGGLGISTGQLTSFQVNAQQFLGMEALRSSVDVQQNASKWGVFGALGLDIDKSRKEDPRLLAFDALGKLTARYNQDQKTGLPPGSDAIIAMGASLGITLDDIRNAAMHPGQLGRARSAMLRDDREMSNTASELQAMTDFHNALDRANASIETTFIHGLAPLAPELTDLSTQFKGFIKDVLGSQNAKDAINFLSGGLHDLGKFLASPEFGKDLKDFGDGISRTAHEFNKEFPKTDKQGGDILNTTNDLSQGAGVAARQGMMGAWDWITRTASQGITVAQGMGIGAEMTARKLKGDYNPARIYAMNQVASKKYGLPTGLLDRLTMVESAYGKNMGPSSAGALGPYQFMPATAQGYGINPLDTKQSSDAAGKMLSGLFHKYHDWSKVVAAYNWGSGNLDADINGYRDRHGKWHPGHGKDWAKHIKDFGNMDTGPYVENITGSRAPYYDKAVTKLLKNVIRKSTPKPATVIIHNKSSANVFYSANAAAWV